MAQPKKEKTQVLRMGRGIFAMLALGTLPTLFSQPGQYLTGLIICGAIAFGLARLLV